VLLLINCFKAENHSTFIKLNYLYYLNLEKCPESVEASLCLYGATCSVDARTNQASCQCGEISCEAYEPMPLCGSDGRTYESLCQLKLTKCLQQRSIKIINHASCGKLKLPFFFLNSKAPA
jgi:hypothetical protein